jgi:hypothetical protein
MAAPLEGARLDWPPIIDRAAQIVASYDTGVTLRQLFYRLVAAGLIPNTQAAYKTLSNKTARARREGAFPDLIDRTRRIHRNPSFKSPSAALAWLAASYRCDRTEGQDVSVYLGVEKDGMAPSSRRGSAPSACRSSPSAATRRRPSRVRSAWTLVASGVPPSCSTGATLTQAARTSTATSPRARAAFARWSGSR